MDFKILHFAIHIVWRANVICTCRKSGIARKKTVAYPEFRLLGLTRDFHPLDNAHAEHTKEISRKVLKLYDLSLDEQSYIETNFT